MAGKIGGLANWQQSMLGERNRVTDEVSASILRAETNGAGETVVSPGLQGMPRLDLSALAAHTETQPVVMIAPQALRVMPAVGSFLVEEIQRSGSPLPVARSRSRTPVSDGAPAVQSLLDSESRLEAAGALLEELSTLKAHLRRARSTLLSGHDENERRRNDARWAVSTPNSATATTRLHTIEGSPTNSFSQFTGDVSALQTPASPLEGAEKAEEQLLQEQLQLTSRRMQELETEVEQGSRALDVANVKLAEQLLLCSTLSARLLWPDEAANDALDALEEDTACTNDPFDGLRGRSPAAEVLSDDPIESLSATSEEFSEMEKKEISAIMPFAISPREDIEAAFNSLQSLGKDSMALGSAGVEEYRGDLEPKRLEEQQKMSAYVTYLAHTLGTPGNQSPTSAGTPRDSRVSPRISLMTPRSRMQGIKRIIRSRDEARALLCWVQHLSSVRADRIRSCQEPCSTSKVEGGGREKHHTDEPQLKEAQVTDVRTLHLSKICSRMTHHIFQQRQKRSKQRVFSVWHTLARDRLWCSKIAKGRIEDVHIKLKSLVLKEWSETCKWRVASRRSQAKLENTSERNNLRNLLQLWGGHSIFQAGKQQLVSALKKRTVLRKTSATLIAWAAATSCQQLSVQECDWDCGFTGPPEDVAAHEKTCEAMLLSTAWKRETELSLRPRVDDDAPKDADRERLMLWLPTDTVIVHASKNLNAWCATGALRRWLPKDSLPRTLSDECAASESSGSVISDKWFQGGRSNSTRVLARLLRLVRDEDDELGAVIASSVANSSSQVAADQVAAALVRTTAQAMSRCLIGDAEAVVLNFLQLLEDNSFERLPIFQSFEPPDVLCGVGMRLTETYPPRAIAILPRGPAGMCGLIEIGDVLVKIEGHDVTCKDITLIRSMIAGQEGTMVSLEFQREVSDGSTRELAVNLRRAMLDLSLEASLESPQGLAVSAVSPVVRSPSRSPMQQGVREILGSILDSFTDETWNVEAALDESTHLLISQFGEDDIISEFKTLEERARSPHPEAVFATAEPSVFFFPVFPVSYPEARPQLPSVVTWSIVPLEPMALQLDLDVLGHADVSTVIMPGMPDAVSEDADEPTIVIDVAEVEDAFHSIAIGSFVPLSSLRGSLPPASPCFNVKLENAALSEEVAARAQERLFWEEEHIQSQEKFEQKVQEYAKEIARLKQRLKDADLELEDSKNIILQLEEKINLSQFEVAAIESEFSSLQQQPAPNLQGADDGIVEDREQYAEHESPVETLHHLQARMSTIVKMIASAALAASSVHKVLKSSEPTEAAQKVNIDTLQADEFQEALTASKTVLAQLAATQEKVKDLEAQLKQVMDELDQLRQEKEAALDSVHQVVLLMVQRDLEAQQRKDLEMQLKSVQDELAQFKRDTDQAGQSLTSLSSQPITPRSKTPDSSQSSAKSRAQLPPGWKEYWSKSKHKPFYKLKETGATFWTLPDHVLKQIVHSSADSPAAMAESKPLVEETATPRDDAYAVTLYRCEFNCGFNSKSFDEMAAHKKEGSCKVKSEQKATVSWGCEHGCDFKGSFEQVLEHEAICDLNPQVMRSAENVGENKIDRENLMAEQAKKLAEKEEQVKKLTEKGELTEKELLILQTELELCNERLEATETELDAFKKSGAETDLVMMNEIATEKSILEVQLNLTLEEVVNLQLQHESSAEDLEAAALLTEKLGLEIRVIADELAQLKLASGGAAVMDSSPSIAIVSLQSSPDKKGPDYTDMPVAVALTLDCDFDDKIRDSETRCTFNDALMSDLSAILDLPKSSLMVVGHQRGSVIAEVVLSGAADDSVGKGLPGYADDRNPAQLAQQLVDAVQGGDRGLRTLPLGQFMSKAEIHGPVAEPVFRALKKAIETAHELALDEFNRIKLFGFQTPTKEILIASPGLQIDVPETPASPQGTQTLHAHTDAGTDAIPTSPLSPRGTQTDGFEEGVARATQMSSPTQANSTQVCLESVVTSTQTMANKMADTGTDAVPQPPQTPRGTQTKVTMTAEAGTGTIEALRSPCGTQTLSPTNTAASIQVMPDVVTVKTQAMPDVAEAEAQTLPEESGIAVQATARTTCEAVQATAEVSDMGVSTDESVASIGKLAVQGLTQVMNAKWILQLSRCCDKSSVQRAFDGWRQEMSDVNALEKKLAWKMSYFNNYLTRPAFRKWCLEMITTYVVRQKVQSADVKHETQLLKDIFAMWSHSANAKFLRECKGTRVHEKVWSRPMSLAFIHWHHLTYWGVSVHRTAARRAHRRAAACLQEWRCKVKKLKGRSSKLSLRELRRRRFVRAKYLHLWEYQTIRMRLRKRSRVACERLHRRTQLFGIFVQWTLHTSRSVRMMLEQNQQKPMLLVHVCPSKRSVLLHAIDRWIFGVTHHLQRAGKVSKASRKRIMMCQTRGFKVWKAMTLRHREAVLQGSKLLDNHIIGVLAANLERFKENRRRCQTLQLWLKAQKMGTLGSALDRWLLAVCKALPEYETVLSDVQNPDKVSDALKPVVLAKQVRNPASDESDVGEAPIRLNFNKAQHLPSTDAKEQSPDSFVEKKKEFSASPISEKSLSPSQSHGHGRLTLWESGTNAQQRRAITQNVNESSDDSFLEGRSNAVATSRVFSSSDDDDLPSPQEQHVRSWGKKWKVNGLNDMHASTSSSPAPERTRVSFSPRSRWTTPQALNSGAKANVSCAKANVRASQSPTSRNTFPGLRISGGSLGDLRSRPLPPARSKTKSDGEHASLNDGNPPHNTSLQSSQHASPKDAAGTPKNLKMLRKKLRMYD